MKLENRLKQAVVMASLMVLPVINGFSQNVDKYISKIKEIGTVNTQCSDGGFPESLFYMYQVPSQKIGGKKYDVVSFSYSEAIDYIYVEPPRIKNSVELGLYEISEKGILITRIIDIDCDGEADIQGSKDYGLRELIDLRDGFTDENNVEYGPATADGKKTFKQAQKEFKRIKY